MSLTISGDLRTQAVLSAQTLIQCLRKKDRPGLGMAIKEWVGVIAMNRSRPLHLLTLLQGPPPIPNWQDEVHKFVWRACGDAAMVHLGAPRQGQTNPERRHWWLEWAMEATAMPQASATMRQLDLFGGAVRDACGAL